MYVIFQNNVTYKWRTVRVPLVEVQFPSFDEHDEGKHPKPEWPMFLKIIGFLEKIMKVRISL